MFLADENVRALVQIYQGTTRTEEIRPVSVRARLVDGSGRTIRDQSALLPESQFTDRRTSIALDLERLPPGEYALTIDASLDQHTARRALRFSVN